MNLSKKGLQAPDSKPEPFERYHTNPKSCQVVKSTKRDIDRYPGNTKPPGIVSQGGPAGSSRHHKHNATAVFPRVLHRDMSWQTCLGGYTSSQNRTQVTSSVRLSTSYVLRYSRTLGHLRIRDYGKSGSVGLLHFRTAVATPGINQLQPRLSCMHSRS